MVRETALHPAHGEPVRERDTGPASCPEATEAVWGGGGRSLELRWSWVGLNLLYQLFSIFVMLDCRELWRYLIGFIILANIFVA